MMALTSVTAARAMAGASDETAALVVVLVLLLGLALGALNGLLIVVTRVPDIVVTLAMLFVLQGAALLVLPSPGGAAAAWLKALITGTVAIPGSPRLTAWIPKALVLLARLPRRRLDPAPPLAARPLDLRHRLERARRLPQRRAGRPHQHRRLRHLRPLRRHGRPVAHHVHRHRRADPRPLPARQRRRRRPRRRRRSAAAAAASLGPIVAVFILRLVRTDLTLLAVDPNVTSIIEGTIMVVVVMFGAFIAMRGRTP